MPSKIAWCDETWNVVTGCSRVSRGCEKCYAERMAGTRLAQHKHYVHLTRISGGEPKWTGDVRFNDVLMQPLRWRKPRRIFVNSMGDLFHESVPDEWLDQVYEVMLLAFWHRFLILTKRPERMLQYVEGALGEGGRLRDVSAGTRGRYYYGAPAEPSGHIWHGVSCENQETADERISLLLRVPGKRFVSCEPLLGAIDFAKVPGFNKCGSAGLEITQNLWVIVGGESGKGYRECEVEWIESIARQCQAAGVPVFVKQDSGVRPGQQGRIPDDLWALKEVPA